MQSPVYTARQWYWRKTDGTVFSSAHMTDFDPAAPGEAAQDYAAWLEAGGRPTPYPRNEQGQEARAALADVLAPYGLALPPATLAEAQALKIAEVNAGYEKVMAYVQAGYPLQEVLSWERQAVQARELAENPQAPALFVRSLAATKGVELEEMARRILANAESWEPIAAMLTAQRQKMEEAAFAAQSMDELAAIKVGYSV